LEGVHATLPQARVAGKHAFAAGAQLCCRSWPGRPCRQHNQQHNDPKNNCFDEPAFSWHMFQVFSPNDILHSFDDEKMIAKQSVKA
jgi:hypothetical protein